MTTNPLESTVVTHIESTSRLVRRVDLAFSLLIVISLLLGGLFFAILADHWLLKDGLSSPMRFGIFAALLAVAGLYIYWKIVPLFRYQINPIYTADLIEKDVSIFKNSLINWLLIRQEREEKKDVPNDKINDRMYDGIVKTAAGNVQNVPAGHVVDVRKLMIAGAVFTMLSTGFVAYTALSPKNPFTTFARVLFPFGDIERPQATQFRRVWVRIGNEKHTGNTTVLQGETCTILAEVVSRDNNEPVRIVYSTDDGVFFEEKITMSAIEEQEGKRVFETPLFPPGKQGFERGFNSSVNYWIIQGGSRSKQYRLDVRPAASVEIVSLQYDFPEYTGLPPEVIENGGNILALEGTTVTVNVRSTLPLQKIDLVYDDNPTNNVSMRMVDDQKTQAKGTFTLKIPFPYKTFSFLAVDEKGNASRRSGIYRIEVIPDQPPRVQWADTAKHLMDDQLDLPSNATLECPIQAEDPDFALRYLRFKVESPGNRIPDMQLLDSPATGPTKHRGQIKKTVFFSPEDKRLTVGETAEIWVEAHDTKLPEVNVSLTRKIRVNVIDPKAKKEEEQKQDKGSEKQPQEKGEQGENQEKGADNTEEKDPNQEGKEGEQGEKPDEQHGSNDREGGEGEQNPNDQEQGEQNQDQNGGAGESDPSGGEQQKNGNERGNSGNELSKEGEQGGDEQPDKGNEKEGNNTFDNQPDEAQKGEGAGDEKTGNKAGQETSVNPETQDGDAMERIVEQMKDEGLFPGANPFLRNDNQRMRNNTIDPNSQNRSNRGNDPSNPKESNQPSDGEPQGQPDKPNNPKEGNDEGKTNSGRVGDMDSQSGNNEGTPQDGEKTQGTQPQGTEGTQGDSGDQQQKQEDGGSDSGDQQSPNNNPQNSSSGDLGSPSEMGGTNGGTGIDKETTPDDPNLKYANEVTNMVLDYLENQLKDKPNNELLNRLGWTEEQLRQFYDKWKTMSEDSKRLQEKEEGPNAWIEALRSMGLLSSQHRRTVRGGQTRTQDNQRVTEARRIPVPPAIQGRFKEYNDNLGQ